MWEVIVGNIGSVHQSDSENDARREYREWCEVANAPHGRASGEEVTLFYKGDVIEYQRSSNEEN